MQTDTNTAPDAARSTHCHESQTDQKTESESEDEAADSEQRTETRFLKPPTTIVILSREASEGSVLWLIHDQTSAAAHQREAGINKEVTKCKN